MLQYLRFSTPWVSIQLATELKERPAWNFCINKIQNNWLKVNAGSTTACLKQTGQEKNDAILPHQNPKNSV
jgi:hypothetical protein